MSDKRNDPDVRLGSLLLSTLVLTPDNALEAYRAKRAADPKVDVELFRQAREVLDAVAHAIRAKDRDNWRRLAEAWEILRHNRPPRAASADAGVVGAPEPVAEPVEEPAAETPPVADETGDVEEDDADTVPPPPRIGEPITEPPPPMMSPSGAGTAGTSPWLSFTAAKARQPTLDLEAEAEVATGVHQRRDSADETLSDVDIRLLRRAILPFDGKAPARPAVTETPRPAPAEVPHPAQGGTKIYVRPDVRPDVPDPDATAVLTGEAPVLTLKQYAAFCAEFQTSSAPAYVAMKYGVASPVAAMALDAEWRVQLARDPSLRSEFEQLVVQYRDWFARNS